MRRAVLVVSLLVFAGACGAKSASGPAWPKSAGRVEVDPEKDGGESLEPQQASHVAAIERAEDRTPVVAAEAIVIDAPSPSPSPATQPSPVKDEPAKAEAKPPTGEIEIIEIKPEDIGIDR